MFKAMLMLLWCLYTNHRSLQIKPGLTHRPSSVPRAQMAMLALSALIWGAAFGVVWISTQLFTSLSSRDLPAIHETLQKEILKLQGSPKVLGTFKAKGDIWGHTGYARSDGVMFQTWRDSFQNQPGSLPAHTNQCISVHRGPLSIYLLFPFSSFLLC